jgi:hypothetical protein
LKFLWYSKNINKNEKLEKITACFPPEPVRLALGPPANVAWPAHADAVRVLTAFIAHRAVMTPRSLTASGVMRCTGDMARAPENHTVGRLNPFKSVNSIQMKLILN